jgi:hypothetical protein
MWQVGGGFAIHPGAAGLHFGLTGAVGSDM